MPKKITMQDWEFLLQKEGEESWMPIFDRHLEAIEGKYRLVGFCRQKDLDVEIRVTFQSVEEGKFLRRSQRSRRTDDRGLVVVMPFTDLKAGTWEFYCRQDRSTEESPQPNPQTLTIQVHPAPEIPTEESETIEPYFTADLTDSLWEKPKNLETSETDDSETVETAKESIDRKLPDKSSAIHLFDPRKVEVEAKQVTPLLGQIMPPKIAGAGSGDPNRQPQLPKFSIPQVEAYVTSPAADNAELDFIDLAQEYAIDRENDDIDEQFQSLQV